MVKWTSEQQAAITKRDTNILVAAAAGSGKTAVLVERIIQKVLSDEDPVHIDELLVATFTNAAAEEMRQRVGIALENAMKEDPTSYHLKKQFSLLQKASISTIHSFCMNVVRQHSYLLDIDPAFRIADDMEIDLLKHEIVDELFEDYYGQSGDQLQQFFSIADMYSGDRSDVELEELILTLHTFAKQHPWPEVWLEQLANVYDVSEDEAEEKLTWLHYLKRDIEQKFTAFKEEIEQAIVIADEADGPYHYIDALEHDMDLIKQVLVANDDWEKTQQLFSTAKLKSLSSKRVECDEEKKEQIKKIRDGFRTEWNKLKKGWFSRSLQGHLADMQLLYPIIKQLVAMVLDFEKRFTALKRERTIVDFNDLEHFSLQILVDENSTIDHIIPSEIATYYQGQFKEILVDEYQDINLVQETILHVISNQSTPGNVFMVGDVKQSIYRFRHAEPTLFIEKYKLYVENKQAGTRIDLAKNFRSREEVLTGANFIFRQIFDESLGEIEYDTNAELIYGNHSYEEHPFEDVETEVLIIDRDDEEDDSENDAIELTKIQLEARLYAKKIREWMGHEGKQPMQVVDKKAQIQRDIQFRDIVILLRSMTGATTIVDELKKQGIPVYAELKTGYFAAIEIQVMVNLLKIIDNPYQDIPFASVLRSPIVGLNEEVLAQIRLMNERVSFFEAAGAFSKVKTIPDANEKVRVFFEQLHYFRRLAREGSLSELIWAIFQETGYYDFVGGIPGGRQRQANLRALYDRARSYEATSFHGLFRFLRFIERMQNKQNDLGEARALSEQEDVVRIMTIHKSKGLEFPVVILGNVNKQFNFSDLRGKYIPNKELGFATKFIDPVKRITYPTLYYLAVYEEEKRKMLSEEMRVLYVALTRAKEKLVMVGNVPSFAKTVEKWRQVIDYPHWTLPIQLRNSAKTYLDWIGPALIRHHQGGVLRDELRIGKAVPMKVQTDPSKWKITIVPQTQIVEEEALKQKTARELQEIVSTWESVTFADKQHEQFVADRLNFHYKYDLAATHRAKQSVTEIKRRYEMIDEYSDKHFVKQAKLIVMKRPSFLQTKKRLTASEIGTAMHTVMQHIPLTKSWSIEQLHDFLDRLVLEEKITEEESKAIDVKAIVHFFTTDIGQMMLSHKVKREIPFTYTLPASEVYGEWTAETEEKVFIQGVIDCLIFTEKGAILLDYKTDQVNINEMDEIVAATLRKRYKIQVTLYRQAIENILSIKVTDAYLYSFTKGLFVSM